MLRKARAGHVTGGRVFGYDNVDDRRRGRPALARRAADQRGRGRRRPADLRAVARRARADGDREDAERGARAVAAGAAGPAAGLGAVVGPRGAATGRSTAARSSGTRRGSANQWGQQQQTARPRPTGFACRRRSCGSSPTTCGTRRTRGSTRRAASYLRGTQRPALGPAALGSRVEVPADRASRAARAAAAGSRDAAREPRAAPRVTSTAARRYHKRGTTVCANSARRADGRTPTTPCSRRCSTTCCDPTIVERRRRRGAASCSQRRRRRRPTRDALDAAARDASSASCERLTRARSRRAATSPTLVEALQDARSAAATTLERELAALDAPARRQRRAWRASSARLRDEARATGARCCAGTSPQARPDRSGRC